MTIKQRGGEPCLKPLQIGKQKETRNCGPLFLKKDNDSDDVGLRLTESGQDGGQERGNS